MKAHIGGDADSGLVHTVVGTAANVNDVTHAHALVYGEEPVQAPVLPKFSALDEMLDASCERLLGFMYRGPFVQPR